MELIAAVIFIALIEYLVFGGFVGKARATYDIPAPATTGNEVFERYFRAHLNTLENLIVFIPSIIGFGLYVHTMIGAVLGAFFIIGRALYFRGYVKEPKSRATGSMISGLSLVILLLGGLIGSVMAFL
mgnify:CR=1 FL=1|jgi:glutathione S-transferase